MKHLFRTLVSILTLALILETMLPGHCRIMHAELADRAFPVEDQNLRMHWYRGELS